MPPREVLLSALETVLYSGQISEGLPVRAFEEKFERIFDLSHAICLYSGTAALHVALILAGVTPGDEVISTAMTAEPTNMAILHAGGRIVWADVDPRNGNLAAESIAGKITHKTKAIMVVHYGGIPAPIESIRDLAESHKIPVVEDAAHALGARYAGRPIGSHSEYTMFSFQAIKHMTTIDGGMLVCSSEKDATRGKLVRWFGIDRSASRNEVDVSTIGYKYHMNNVNATIGIVQLDYVQDVIASHICNGRYFDAAFANVPGIELCTWNQQAEPSYWIYTLLVERRGDFIRCLADHGISASIVHKRNDLHSVFAPFRCPLPNLDLFSERMVHIPCGWWVTAEDREYIVDVVKKGW